MRNGRKSDRTFSQRHGYESLPAPMRLEELSADLRREVWDTLRLLLLSIAGRGVDGLFFPAHASRFIERTLGRLTKTPHDSVDISYTNVTARFKRIILQEEFNVVLDLLEIITIDHYISSDFLQDIANLFERHTAAYYLETSRQPYFFVPRVSPEQAMATQDAIEILSSSNMDGATTHLRNAADHLRKHDWGSAIADSIHAVESVARMIDPQANRSLGAALDSLERAGLLKHPALKQAFSKLYGYTSDEQGIRHALLDRSAPDVGLDEAMFMFGACASFAAYLAAKQKST